MRQHTPGLACSSSTISGFAPAPFAAAWLGRAAETIVRCAEYDVEPCVIPCSMFARQPTADFVYNFPEYIDMLYMISLT